MVECLLNLHLEVVEVHHVVLDLVDWKFDKHTSDLWCFIITNELLDIFVDATTDLLLQVRVVGVQSWDILQGRLGISLSNGHLTLWNTLHLLLVWHHWHAWLLLLLRHSTLRHWLTSHHTWIRHLSLHLLTWHLTWLSHLLLLLLVLTTHLVVVSSWAWAIVSSSVVVATRMSSSTHIILDLSIGLLIKLNDTEKLLEHLSQMRLRGKIIPFEPSSLLSLVLLPIGFVTSLLHLKLSDFLDFIVVDKKHLSTNGMVLEVLFSLSGIGWLFVADKGKWITSLLSSVKSDVLNLSIVFKKILQVLLSILLREVLYIQVASFL